MELLTAYLVTPFMIGAWSGLLHAYIRHTKEAA